MNYADLKEAIKAFMETDFPTTTASNMTSDEQLALFVRQAEQRVHHEFNLLPLRKNQTTNLTASNKYLTVPSDWLAPFSLAVVDNSGRYGYLVQKDVSFLREAYPNPASTGLPKFYCLFDEDSLMLAPTPDDTYTVEFHYFYMPTSIVDAGTSWLGDNFDSVLLYGALLEAATFQQQQESAFLEMLVARYNEALALLEEFAEGKQRRDAYRTEQKRVVEG